MLSFLPISFSTAFCISPFGSGAVPNSWVITVSRVERGRLFVAATGQAEATRAVRQRERGGHEPASPGHYRHEIPFACRRASFSAKKRRQSQVSSWIHPPTATTSHQNGNVAAAYTIAVKTNSSSTDAAGRVSANNEAWEGRPQVVVHGHGQQVGGDHDQGDERREVASRGTVPADPSDAK